MISKYIPLITNTLYSLIGVIFLGWDVFFLVYLFWFENFIRIFSYRFKARVVSHALVNNETVLTREENGQLIAALREPFRNRLFMYFIYFVFIIIGGFVFSILQYDKEGTPQSVFTFISIILFQHLDFNIALILCIINEVVVYFRDFKINKIYTEKNPFKASALLEKEDIVIHVSLLLTGVFAFVGAHPAFKEMLGTNITEVIFKNLTYIPGIVLISIKFIIIYYSIKSGEKTEEGGGVSLPSEKEDAINRLNNFK